MNRPASRDSDLGLVAMRRVSAVRRSRASSGLRRRARDAPRSARAFRTRRPRPAPRAPGSAMRRDLALDVPVAKRRREPDVVPAAERRVGVVVVAREARRAGRWLGRRRAPSRCCAIETSSTKMCGATATTPATAGKARGVHQRDRAAVAVAEEPGLARRRRRALEERAAAPRAPARCMKSTRPALVARPRRRAAVAVAREDEAARSRAASQNSRGKSRHIATEPRPSCRNTTQRRARARAPIHSYSSRGRPRQSIRRSSTDANSVVDDARAPARARAAGSAGSCRSPSSAARR